jgi:hypothetical protein
MHIRYPATQLYLPFAIPNFRTSPRSQVSRPKSSTIHWAHTEREAPITQYIGFLKNHLNLGLLSSSSHGIIIQNIEFSGWWVMPSKSSYNMGKNKETGWQTMSKSKSNVIQVLGTDVSVVAFNDLDFISLTDMARKFGDDVLIYNWMRNRNTLEFIGIWEQIHNPDFKGIEFETFRKKAGLNSFSLTPRKWIDATGAIGFQSRAGRYGGGTYAHKDIAFEFGSWLSPEFKLYLIKEFQRLKDDESERLKLGWNLQRTLAKINYRIHTDAIKETLIPPTVSKSQANLVYANEADLLNVALFGMTAQQWRSLNPELEGNIRDYAPLEQLVVLTNLESLNSVLVRQGLPQSERLCKLNEIAISQMQTLLADSGLKRLKGAQKA